MPWGLVESEKPGQARAVVGRQHLDLVKAVRAARDRHGEAVALRVVGAVQLRVRRREQPPGWARRSESARVDRGPRGSRWRPSRPPQARSRPGSAWGSGKLMTAPPGTGPVAG